MPFEVYNSILKEPNSQVFFTSFFNKTIPDIAGSGLEDCWRKVGGL
jgi:hypothetical protein